MNLDKYLNVFGGCEECFFFSALLYNSHAAQSGPLKLEHQWEEILSTAQVESTRKTWSLMKSLRHGEQLRRLCDGAFGPGLLTTMVVEENETPEY